MGEKYFKPQTDDISLLEKKKTRNEKKFALIATGKFLP
jgi:hypothetical protein